MDAVDTNVIVRLLTKDDRAQFNKALKLFEEKTVFVSLTVLQETEWVLRYCYGFSTEDINHALVGMLGLSNVEVEKPQIAEKALSMHRTGLDFSDALHLAQSYQCDCFYTFDKELINKTKQNDSCKVSRP